MNKSFTTFDPSEKILNVKAGCAFIKEMFENGKLEEAISYVYSVCSYPMQRIVDDLAHDWEENIELLVTIKKLIPKHPEWKRVQPAYLSCIGTIVPPRDIPLEVFIDSVYVGDIEKDVKRLIDAGLVDKDYLSCFVNDIMHPDYIDYDVFEKLAKIREIANRNPDWTVDWGSEHYNVVGSCGLKAYPCVEKDDKRIGLEFVERLMSEGYWTPKILQNMIDRIYRSKRDDLKVVLPNVARLLSNHPEWVYTDANGVARKVSINIEEEDSDLTELVFGLGADQVTVEGQSMIDKLASTHSAFEARVATKFFSAKL